jgi:hypothetical protein
MPKNLKEALVVFGALVVVSAGLVGLATTPQSLLGLIVASTNKATTTPKTFDQNLLAAGLKTDSQTKAIPACTSGKPLSLGISAKTFTYTGKAVQGVVSKVQALAAANDWQVCYYSSSAITYIKGGRLLGLTWSTTTPAFARVQYEY